MGNQAEDAWWRASLLVGFAYFILQTDMQYKNKIQKYTYVVALRPRDGSSGMAGAWEGCGCENRVISVVARTRKKGENANGTC